MTRRGWLSRSDFEDLDRLLGLLGYGGYYDVLECLKTVGDHVGAFSPDISGPGRDRGECKTIPDVLAVLGWWSSLVAEYRRRNPNWDRVVLQIAEEEVVR